MIINILFVSYRISILKFVINNINFSLWKTQLQKQKEVEMT